MKPRRILILLAAFFLLLGLLSAGVHTLTSGNTLGTDFFIFWQAGRGFLFEHTSPYSEDFALRSQLAVFKPRGFGRRPARFRLSSFQHPAHPAPFVPAF
jgi:hypothetical protein